jgi:hypothetical protein
MAVGEIARGDFRADLSGACSRVPLLLRPLLGNTSNW